MRDAIARVVTDGASVCMGTALEACIPFAAGHEIIRQGRRDLTLVGPISDMLFAQIGVTREAALAAKRVIVAAEDVWPAARILADPNLVLVPSIKVDAVGREPWDALPSPVQGYYGRDHEPFARYHAESKTSEGYRAWLDKWVLGIEEW